VSSTTALRSDIRSATCLDTLSSREYDEGLSRLAPLKLHASSGSPLEGPPIARLVRVLQPLTMATSATTTVTSDSS
jgi:hypothetical protein